jgi:hypothetical protein
VKVYLDDKTFIKSDEVQFLLVEEKTVREGKNKGKINEVVIGFYGTITDCIRAFIKQRQLESKATTLHELLKETKELREYVTKLVEGYDA